MSNKKLSKNTRNFYANYKPYFSLFSPYLPPPYGAVSPHKISAKVGCDVKSVMMSFILKLLLRMRISDEICNDVFHSEELAWVENIR